MSERIVAVSNKYFVGELAHVLYLLTCIIIGKLSLLIELLPITSKKVRYMQSNELLKCPIISVESMTLSLVMRAGGLPLVGSIFIYSVLNLGSL